MEQTDVDLNRLRATLGKSKSLMGVVESNSYSKGNVDRSRITSNNDAAPRASRQPMDAGHPDYTKNVTNSRLPDHIKQAMLETPIYGSDLSGGIKQPTKEDFEQQYQQKPRVVESKQQNNEPTTINREEIKSMVEGILAEMMVKTISENVMKRTISKLMSEGKIKK